MSDPKSTAPLFLMISCGQVLSVGNQTFIRRMTRDADGKEVWTEETRGTGPYTAARTPFRNTVETSSIDRFGPLPFYPLPFPKA